MRAHSKCESCGDCEKCVSQLRNVSAGLSDAETFADVDTDAILRSTSHADAHSDTAADLHTAPAAGAASTAIASGQTSWTKLAELGRGAIASGGSANAAVRRLRSNGTVLWGWPLHN